MFGGLRGAFASGRDSSGDSSGIRLRLSDAWQGRSNSRAGRAEARFNAVTAAPRRAWRAGTALFLIGVAGYGLAVGGYFERSMAFMANETTGAIARAGFRIDKLTIEGQERTSDQDIAGALGVGNGAPALTYDTGAAQLRLEQLPWVKRAQVMRLLPSRLHVVIEERAPYAVWQHNGSLYLVDEDGLGIAPLSSPRPDLPFIVGDGAPKAVKPLFATLTSWPEFARRVKASVRVAERRWNLQLDNGIEIRLPENNIENALAKLSELDREHKVLSNSIASVDLRIPGRVTVRLTDDAAARRSSAPAGAPAERDT
ncbi:MAG: cell division protein FtsQ/DivIB [Pseudomonadota bacterium]|nr:cell division protein FtsQ/DivIB [Pseudomonadota bacterium]